MRLKGWLYFSAVQAIGIGLVAIGRDGHADWRPMLGGVFLIPGSWLWLMIVTTFSNRGVGSPSFALFTSTVVGFNALLWGVFWQIATRQPRSGGSV